MNVNLPKSEKIKKRTLVIYITVAIICVIAIGVIIGTQILGTNVINAIFGINKLISKTEEDEAKIKAEFQNIFNNKLDVQEEVNVKKIQEDKEIVYTYYEKSESLLNNYDIKINIPYINIDNEEVKKYNEDLKIFENKAEEVLNKEEQNVIFNVKYQAYIENNLLSLIVYSELKEGANAQRLIIQTFCFDLKENKKMSLEDILKLYNLDKNIVQDKISNEIQQEQDKSDELKKLGYNVFSRDINSDIYKIENTTEFFVHDNILYILYPYGNNMDTSEMDIIIL